MKVRITFTYILLAAVLSVTLAGITWEPEPRDDDEWWMGRHYAFVNTTRDNGTSVKVLFYGDSIMERWWSGEGQPIFEEYYSSLALANYAIGSDRTEHLLWRMKNGEVTDDLNPSVCVIKIGTNNIFDNDVTSIALGIVYNVIELREKLPNMKVLLLGVLPRSDEEVTNRTSAINDIIQKLDNGRSIRFLDMKEHFYRGGNDFNAELYTSDLLHLSEAGYRKWGEVMDPLFREMLENP